MVLVNFQGCTDQTALNYNQNATDDDGSCIAVILGCMDAAAVNYDANANTDNGMCQPYTLADVEAAEELAYTAGFEDGPCRWSCRWCYIWFSYPY